MARLAPKLETLRALFARSGNQCAFPGCTQPLINKKNLFIGQVCHIEAANVGGERYNKNSTDEYRRSYDNLFLLCYPHHVETDNVDEYSVERLTEMKLTHESLFEKSDFKIDESELMKLTHKMNEYWNEIDRLNQVDHLYKDVDLTMEVNGQNNFFDLTASLKKTVDAIEYLMNTFHKSDEQLIDDLKTLLQKKEIEINIFDDIPYYENPFVNRNWESHNIGKPNWFQRLRIDLTHMEVKYLEEYLKTNSDDLKAHEAFEKTKELLKKYAQSAMHVD